MIFRAARHTNNLDLVKDFYMKVLGLELLGSFENHDSYNGIFLGKKDEDWHLEFTQSNDNVTHEFDDDDLWVFYPNTDEEYQQFLKNIAVNNIEKIKPKNPYWKNNGITINDPDGFCIVVSNLKVTKP